MSRKTDPLNTRPRKVPLPSWWCASVRRLSSDWTDEEFARRLTVAVGRRPPWFRTTIGDFFRDKTATPELVDAICKLFGPELPGPVFTARTYSEARTYSHISSNFRDVESAREELDFELEALEKRIRDRLNSSDGKGGGRRTDEPRAKSKRVMGRSRPPSTGD